MENQPKNESEKVKSLKPLLISLAVLLLGSGALNIYQWQKRPEVQATPTPSAKTMATISPTVEATITPTATLTPTSSVPNNFSENAAAALNTMNTAYFEQLFATPVSVIIAASEGIGNRTPAQAVADLEYFKTATTPWDFNLPASTTDSWKTGSYSSYLAKANVFGMSKSGQVVAFTFNSSAKITAVFMAANSDVLN